MTLIKDGYLKFNVNKNYIQNNFFKLQYYNIITIVVGGLLLVWYGRVYICSAKTKYI